MLRYHPKPHRRPSTEYLWQLYDNIMLAHVSNPILQALQHTQPIVLKKKQQDAEVRRIMLILIVRVKV